MSVERKTFYARFFGPLQPLQPSQLAFRVPFLVVLLLLIALNVSIFFYFLPMSVHTIGAWLNLSVVAMLFVQHLAFYWVREGRAGLIMKSLSYLVTVAGCIVVGLYSFRVFHPTAYPARVSNTSIVKGDEISPTAEDIVQQSRARYAALYSYDSTGEATYLARGKTTITKFSIRLQRPNLYRIAWQFGAYNGSVWSDGTGNYFNMFNEPPEEKDRDAALAHASDVSNMIATTIAKAFFNDIGNELRPDLLSERKPDEKVGDFNCFVLSTPPQFAAHGTATTIWIGQKDFLIHQHRTAFTAFVRSQTTDTEWANYLKGENKPVTPEAIAILKAAETKNESEMEKELQTGPIIWIQTQKEITLNKTYALPNFAR
jgi:outer membrane lipoprotein-sorting protein